MQRCLKQIKQNYECLLNFYETKCTLYKASHSREENSSDEQAFSCLALRQQQAEASRTADDSPLQAKHKQKHTAGSNNPTEKPACSSARSRGAV